MWPCAGMWHPFGADSPSQNLEIAEQETAENKVRREKAGKAKSARNAKIRVAIGSLPTAPVFAGQPVVQGSPTHPQQSGSDSLVALGPFQSLPDQSPFGLLQGW